MEFTRRAFMKAGMSTTAQGLFGRYSAILRSLGTIGPATLTNTASMPTYLYEAYNLFQFVSPLYEPSDSGSYIFDPTDCLPFDNITMSDLPLLSQKALQKAYQQTVDSLHFNIIEVFHVLKYGKDVERLISDFDTYAEELSQIDMSHISATRLMNIEIRERFGSEERMKAILGDILQNHKNVMQVIGQYLNSSSREALSRKTLLDLTGTGEGISYLFNLENTDAVAELMAMDYHGVFFNVLDLPKPMQELLRNLSMQPKIRTALSKNILMGDDGYFNADLARKLGVSEDEIHEGMKVLVRQKMEWEGVGEDISYADRTKPLDVSPDAVAEGLKIIQSMIDEGFLKVTTEDKQIFKFVLTQSDDTRLQPELDEVADTLSFAFSREAMIIDRDGRELTMTADSSGYASFRVDAYVDRTKLREKLGHNPVNAEGRIKEGTPDDVAALAQAFSVRFG